MIQHPKYFRPQNRQPPQKAPPQGLLVVPRQGKAKEDYPNSYLLNPQAAKTALRQQLGQY